MANVWRLAVNDLRLTLKDRAVVVWLVVLPIALMWFFGQLGGPSTSGPQKISLTVDDRDGGWLARELVAELPADRFNLVDLARLAPEERPEERVRTLIIPAGFTAGVEAGRVQTLELAAEAGSSREFGLAAQVHILRAAGRSLARLAELRGRPGGGGEPPEGWAPAFAALRERPPQVTLAVSHAGKGRPIPGGVAQSVPGMLTMMVMMMTLIYGATFLTLEKQEGMLRRQAAMPVSRWQIFAGKLGGRVLVAAAQAAILVLAGRFLFGLSFGSSAPALAVLLGSYIFAAAGLSTLLGALLSTPAQAESVGWIVGMVLAALSGCWWPSEVMPAWLQTAGRALPTAWAMEGFHQLISFGNGLAEVTVPALVLLGFGAAAATLGARFLRYE